MITLQLNVRHPTRHFFAQKFQVQTQNPETAADQEGQDKEEEEDSQPPTANVEEDDDMEKQDKIDEAAVEEAPEELAEETKGEMTPQAQPMPEIAADDEPIAAPQVD